MSIHHTVRTALDLNYRQYDDFRNSCFLAYCEHHAPLLAVPVRFLTSNDHLLNWYHQQWQYMVENRFYYDYMDYLEAAIEDSDRYQELIISYPDNIEKYYPKPMFNRIKSAYKKYEKTLDTQRNT